jgi:hypothetical protein
MSSTPVFTFFDASSDALDLVQPSSPSAPSESDYSAYFDSLPYEQRLQAILRAIRLPKVINLGNYRRPSTKRIGHSEYVMCRQEQFQLACQLRAHHHVSELNLCGQRMDMNQMGELLEPISLQRTMKRLNLNGACWRHGLLRSLRLF